MDETTGLRLLQLPDGFRYMSYSWTGDPLRGGVPCPNLHDGMAVVDEVGHSGKLILVRNHEGDVGTPYLSRQSITYAGDGAGENPDNITVTPRGGLMLCEDNSGGGPNDAERLLGLTLTGGVFTFAKNNIVLASSYNSVIGPGDYRQNEWAGACYSPDGKWLFVNIQTPGVTFAITRPWGSGPL